MTMDADNERKEALGPPVQRPVGRPVPKRASECGLTECRGKPMCGRCLQWSDIGELRAALPDGVRWQDPLTPSLVRDLLAFETRRWEEALRLTWQMVDPLKPDGQPGSYARGSYNGIVDALTTLRANLKTPNAELTGRCPKEVR